jgi:hypothetical protein
MATGRSATEVLDVLSAQAACLWGEEEAERQRSGLQRTAEEIAVMELYTLPPDLEPQFF